jgi:MFS family permease
VSSRAPEAAAKGTGLVLVTLAAGQFLMTLDSSVMNVSIATVARDVGTTVTGIQTAITLYTLVMAMFMVTGGKVGSIIGRRRAFAIGCVIYGAGSLTTALAPNLAVLVLARRVQDAPPESRPKLDLVGTLLSATGLGLAVFGVLRSSEWGWALPRPDGPEVLGVSPVVWLVLGGLFVVWLFLGWERRLEAKGAEPLVRPELLSNGQLAGGLVLFFYQ